jgi:hypothetical protein
MAPNGDRCEAQVNTIADGNGRVKWAGDVVKNGTGGQRPERRHDVDAGVRRHDAGGHVLRDGQRVKARTEAPTGLRRDATVRRSQDGHRMPRTTLATLPTVTRASSTRPSLTKHRGGGPRRRGPGNGCSSNILAPWRGVCYTLDTSRHGS